MSFFLDLKIIIKSLKVIVAKENVDNVNNYVISEIETLKKVDEYMQDEQRYIITGVHNKKNHEKVPYEFLKKCNYMSLVNEYYKYKEK